MAFISHKSEALADLDGKLKRMNEIIGGMAESYAKALAPVDTGRLRNSIAHDSENNYHVVVIGSNVFYAPFQELGAPNANVPPHPFLRPAIERHIDEYREVVKSVLRS